MRVCAVIVAYHADSAVLQQLVDVLSKRAYAVVVVDNTPQPVLTSADLPDICVLLSMCENAGIARAQNVGIREAIALGADAVALFDQDSSPDEDLLSILAASLDPDLAGVVAPVCFDARSGDEIPSYRIDRWGLPRKVFAAGAPEAVSVDLVIASGSVVTSCTFAQAGFMDDDLFIDYVDFEWCLRCRSSNVPIRIIPAATMRHSIGERLVDLVAFGGVIHSAARSYYKIRNCFHLFRRSSVPRLYAVREFTTAFVQYAAMLPFVRQPSTYLLEFWHAIRDGLKGVTGPNPAARDPQHRASVNGNHQ